jgi:hypothetical protein
MSSIASCCVIVDFMRILYYNLKVVINISSNDDIFPCDVLINIVTQTLWRRKI